MQVQEYKPGFVSITDSAKQHLVSQIKQADGIGVELGVKPSGCAGFEYTWNIVSEYYAQEYRVTNMDDYVLIVNDMCAEFIEGSQVDLLDEGIKGQTLTVSSPKATGGCGCGESVTFEL